MLVELAAPPKGESAPPNGAGGPLNSEPGLPPNVVRELKVPIEVNEPVEAMPPKLLKPAPDLAPKGDVAPKLANPDFEDAPKPPLGAAVPNPPELVVPPKPLLLADPTALNGDFSELAKADRPDDLKADISAGLISGDNVAWLADLGEARLPNGEAVDASTNPLDVAIVVLGSVSLMAAA